VSLRARLLVALVVLVAAGLAVAAAVTYAEQRSFLYDRVDQQVVAAAQQVPANGGGEPGVSERGGGPGLGFGGLFGRGGDIDAGGGPGAGGGPAGGRPGPSPPSNTIVERLDASGRVTFRSQLFGESGGAYPSLPKDYPVSTSTEHPKLFDAGATGGSSVRFRTMALRAPGSSTTTVFAVPLTDVQQTLHRLLLVELLVAAAVLIALVVAAWFVIGGALRPLDRIGRTAGEIAAGDLSRRVSPETPRTEVGRLGIALNRMLVTIEQAFADRRRSEDRLRRFLADASHELRTPLASIRGYAELFRLGATDDPADLAKAMERIEAEAARMGVLVEDLLLLARLDEMPDDRAEAVDLSELAEAAARDARAMAPDRVISVAAGGEEPLRALGDPDRLHQVVANLLRNAITHTPAGTPIDISLDAAEPARVTMSVRDHGPGLPDGVGDRVFERFWRSEGGRTRGKAGAGLGLAIVQAIVHAHGGEVHAQNADGGGAVFVVVLPAAGVSAKSQERPSLVASDEAKLSS